MIQWPSLNEAIKAVALDGTWPGERVFIVVDDHFWTQVAAKIGSEPSMVVQYLVRELRDDWRVAFEEENESEELMVLPLIAIQLYAAHKMRKGGEYGPNAYNPRLLEVLSRDGDQAWLQSQYGEYQDWAWEEAQFALESLGHLFPIPPESSGAGRYVQYPRLHALLNEQDLNSISHYFHATGFLPRDQYSFEEFHSTLDLANIAQYEETTAHFGKLIKDEDNHELLFAQIYRWFNKWDGIPIRIEKRKNTFESKQRTPVEKLRRLLTLTSNRESDSWKIQVIDSKGKIIKDFGFEENLLSRIFSTYPIPNIELGYVFFEYDSQYEEFVFCPKLHVGQKCAVIRDKQMRRFGVQILSSKFLDLKEPFQNEFYEIQTFSLTAENVKHLPSGWTTGKSKSVFLKNGIRISRNEWLQGAGPELVTQGEISNVWLNGQRIDIEESANCLDLSKVEAGNHAIIIPQHSTLFFAIVTPNSHSGSGIESGWNVTNCCPDKENAHLIGSYLAAPPERTSVALVSPVREWINTLLTPVPKNSNHTIVIKSLIRRKYGI